MISLLLLISSYVFGVSTWADKEKNVFGAFLAVLICIVLFMVALEAFKTFCKRPQTQEKVNIAKE
jgi:uncharacterized membrane protein